MFGRKKRRAADEDELDELVEQDGSDDDPAADPDDPEDTEDEDSGVDAEPEDELDEWQRLDASRDWREEGPFDLSEVDLDADDVERMDFDALILTPFDGMQLQLQVNQQTQQLQALLVVSGQSVMELSLFAAPAGRDMRADVRGEMIANAQKAGGKATLTEGPFGTEVRRVVIDLDDPGDLPDASFLESVAVLVSGHDGSAARDLARSWLLAGGEDHGLLATVPADAFDRLPAGARVIGRVLSLQASAARVLGRRPGVLLAGEPPQEHTGWDHFSHT